MKREIYRQAVLAALAGLVLAPALLKADWGLGLVEINPGLGVGTVTHTQAPAPVTTPLDAGAYWCNVVPEIGAQAILPLDVRRDDTDSDGVAEYQMFCLDITAPASDSTANGGFSLVDAANAPEPETAGPNHPMGVTRREWLRLLAQEYWTDDYLVSGIDPSGGTASSNIDVRYAAMQLAIWEIVYEGDSAGNIPATWNPLTGDFYLKDPNTGSTAVADEANRILAVVENAVSDAGGNVSDAVEATTYIAAFVSDMHQDMLTLTTRDRKSVV